MAALLWPAGAGAADWVKLRGADADHYFYDKSKIAVSGDEVTYWKRVVFKTPPSVKGGLAKSALYRERIHCAEHTLKTLAYLFYGEGGAVLEQANFPDAEAQPVIPGTLGDEFERALCPLAARQRRAEAELKKQEDQLAASREELKKLRAELKGAEEALARLRQSSESLARELKPADPESAPAVPPPNSL